ncbi:MAG: DNA polymerase I [Candidatus Marinimicrobia bacterium]|nr:DNA polymerase I [Candidatus Neomarinimicrobiota bacterium]
MKTKKRNKKRMFLIDGYAMLYRAHFAMIRNPLITSYGLPTSALFGFLNQLFRILNKESPDFIATIFDRKEKTFRHKKYPDYKANRDPMPEELQIQLPHLWKLIDALQIPNLSKKGYEADDIIGTLAVDGSKNNFEVFIVSGDKDFMQLINDNVFLYAPGTKNKPDKIYDKEGVKERWGVPPEKIIDLFGLMGDSSDNIPGVSGVGPKSAMKLINEYDTLEEALNNAEIVANKRVRNGLLEGKENAILSKDLVTIVTDLPLEYNLKDFENIEFNKSSLESLLIEYEFHALINQLPGTSDSLDVPIKKSKKDYNIIQSLDELKKFVKSVKQKMILSFDIETDGLNAMQNQIVGISFSTKEDTGVYIPIEFKNKSKNLFGDNDISIVIDIVRPIMEDENILKTGQNVKFDMLIYKRYGVNVKGLICDSMLAAHLLKPESRSYKLDNLSIEYLNYKMVPIEDLIGKGKNQITMSEVELDQAGYYACEDADISLKLTNIFLKELKNAGLDHFYNKIELPLIDVLLNMEFEGTYVDKEMLEEMSIDLSKKVENLSTEIIKEAGAEFNINSTQQLAKILFDDLNLTKVKQRSTAEPILEALRNEHPLPNLILEYRKLAKLKNTYVDSLPPLINKSTGRIHTTFSQTIASTGRLSSSSPNFQNIPIRTEEGREIRKAFKAQNKDWLIFSADYSQIELRIMAHLSRDSTLIESFNNNEDIHTRTASDVYGVKVDDVLPDMRRTAKVVNFGIMYGAGPFRLSQELGIPRSEAQVIIDTYFDRYIGIRDYMDKTIQDAEKQKFVQTVLGRRRNIWNVDSENHMQREAAKRMAINMPIQGTAAEMIKLAMLDINRTLQNEHYQSRMILQIHDELLFECPLDEIDKLEEMVKDKMVNAMPLIVPLVVDCGKGISWFDAH